MLPRALLKVVLESRASFPSDHWCSASQSGDTELEDWPIGRSARQQSVAQE